MGNLSKHFFRSEFRCRCQACDCDTVDGELLTILEEIRNHFGPVTITSGNRCAARNKSEGGAEKSQHLLGRAADFQARDATPSEVQGFIAARYPTTLGLGCYDNFTHLDTRNGRARWGN